MLAAVGLIAAGDTLGATAALPAGAATRVFDVRQFGAVGDGQTLTTEALNAAVTACHAAGGGLVYLPPGRYLSGMVELRSRVTLYLDAGATLLGSTKLADYAPRSGPPARGDANQRHLIFARDAEDLGLAGPGCLDGQGPAFWEPSGRVKPSAADGWRDVATYDWKPRPRPSPLLEFYNCTNLHLTDVRIQNAPGWTLRPIHCDNVFIRGLRIHNPVWGPNTDGIDPTCCRNVLISDCLIETGDDAICLKSENPYGEALRPTRNITITNCILSSCCNGLKFGTATRGGFENIVFSNSVIFNDDVPLNARVISGIALEMVDGGWLEGVLVSNIRMQRVRTPIFIRRGNRTPRPDGTPGTLRGVMIENIHATDSVLTSSVTGLPGFDIEEVTLSNLRFESQEGGPADWTHRLIPELPRGYPEARNFGRLPAFGFYFRHVRGLRLRHLELSAARTEARPAVFCEDVKDLELDGLRSAPTVGQEPVVRLVQTKRAWVRGCGAPPGTKAFLEVRGDQSEEIVLTDNQLLAATEAVRTTPEVPPRTVAALGNATRL